MDSATLYLIFAAVSGGPERKVVEHFDTGTECEEKIARWENDARKYGKYRVVSSTCLTPKEYNTMVGVFTTDMLDPKYRH